MSFDGVLDRGFDGCYKASMVVSMDVVHVSAQRMGVIRIYGSNGLHGAEILTAGSDDEEDHVVWTRPFGSSCCSRPTEREARMHIGLDPIEQ